MISFKNLGNLGRLGNQLFQMAATVALAVENNDDYVFPPWPDAPNFNLIECFANNIPNFDTFREPGFTYTKIPYRPNLNLEGYFQSEKYFADSKDVIQSLFTPKMGFGIHYNHTAVHVRRGDYLNLRREYVQLDMNYYATAMQMISSKHYVIFSDDMAWCRANFHGDNIIFYEGGSPARDLAMMANCEHTIIANSSFSWWGAYLNKSPSKIVIAPQGWFGPALPHDTKDLLPKEWIRI
jgi:hypothetical protein